MPSATQGLPGSRLGVSWPASVSLLLLAVYVGGCVDSAFVEPPPTMTLTAAPDTIDADGISSALIRAVLPGNVPDGTVVEFATDLGRFLNPGGAPDRRVSVPLRDGLAEARLTSAGELGNARVISKGAASTAEAYVRFRPAQPDSIDLFLDRIIAPADGVTAVTATAVLRKSNGSISAGTPVRIEVFDAVTGASVPELSGTVLSDNTSTAKLRLLSVTPARLIVMAISGPARSTARTLVFSALPTSSVDLLTIGGSDAKQR